jgi:uncharacterized protein
MNKMNPVIHFEIPADDQKRMSDFYSGVFGWQVQKLGPEMNEYILVTTTDTGDNGMPKNAGSINGGFYRKSTGMPNQYPSLVIGVDDIGESARKVTAAGGKLHGDPYDIPGVGKLVYFEDTEGNISGMLQPLPMNQTD